MMKPYTYVMYIYVSCSLTDTDPQTKVFLIISDDIAEES